MEILKTVDLSHILDPEELEPNSNKFEFKLEDQHSDLAHSVGKRISVSQIHDETITTHIDYNEYQDIVQQLAGSFMDDFGIEKRSVEYLKGIGVDTFEKYKYYMTNDLDMINRIVDYTNSFIEWAIKVDPNVYGYHPYQFASVPKLPDPTEQYINALEYIWNKYSGVV